RLSGHPNASPYVKDAFHRYLIEGERTAVNQGQMGSKAAAHYTINVPAGGTSTIRLRLTSGHLASPFDGFDALVEKRIAEAYEFYERITPHSLNEDERRVRRQALAGMLWSKQFYYFDLERWLIEHKSHPLLESDSHTARNAEWFHMLNADVISMPDKWEYP